MFKVVYAEGCSITGGAEHKDWRMTKEGLEYSETTWAARIHQQCFPNAKYFPTAKHSSSNSHIRRRAIFYLTQLLKEYKGEEIVCLIQWTDIHRREVRAKNIQDTRKYHSYIDVEERKYATILPIDLPGEHFSNKIINQKDRDDWLKRNDLLNYFREFNLKILNDEASMYETLTEIETVRNFCKLHKIQMYETSAFGELLWLDKFKTTDKFILDLLRRVDILNTSFYYKKIKNNNLPLSMYDWAKERRFTLGPGGHPLEDLHEAWARMMIAHYSLVREK